MFAVRTLSTGTIIIGRLTPIFDFGFINFEDNNLNVVIILNFNNLKKFKS